MPMYASLADADPKPSPANAPVIGFTTPPVNGVAAVPPIAPAMPPPIAPKVSAISGPISAVKSRKLAPNIKPPLSSKRVSSCVSGFSYTKLPEPNLCAPNSGLKSSTLTASG